MKPKTKKDQGTPASVPFDLEDQLKDLEVKAAYDVLGPEFDLIRQDIEHGAAWLAGEEETRLKILEAKRKAEEEIEAASMLIDPTIRDEEKDVIISEEVG